MAEVQKKPVKIVETVLRDAHQSLLATRMSTDQMLPIVDRWIRSATMQWNAGAAPPLTQAFVS